MAYLGRYRQGDYVFLFCQTKDKNGVPTVPVDSPQAKIWAPGGVLVASLQIPVIDRYVPVPGLFAFPLRLDYGFSATGMYLVNYHYLLPNVFRGLDQDNFEVLEGGNPDGNIVAMYAYQRPNGQFIVQELDSGNLAIGRNPKLT